MQTILPYADFVDSASCLDDRRLDKQRDECKQVLLTLKHDGSWKNHPAVRMWRGHETALAAYGRAVCEAWIARGYKDDKLAFFIANYDTFNEYPLPWWIGWEGLHSSHRAALLFRDPKYYSVFGWTEKPAQEFLWPV